MMRLNRTSEWKVMTILISRELQLFNFERLDIWCAWIGHPSEKLWQFQFLKSFRCSILSVSICDVPESDLRVITYDHLNFSRDFVFSISSVSIYDAPESDIRVESYDNFNFSRNSNGHKLSHGGPIQEHHISRRSKLNNGSSWEIEIVTTFHSDVRFRHIRYRDARN